MNFFNRLAINALTLATIALSSVSCAHALPATDEAQYDDAPTTEQEQRQIKLEIKEHKRNNLKAINELAGDIVGLKDLIDNDERYLEDTMLLCHNAPEPEACKAATEDSDDYQEHKVSLVANRRSLRKANEDMKYLKDQMVMLSK
jgi:hypothetical protein